MIQKNRFANPVDTRNKISITTGTTYRIIKLYKPALLNVSPFRSTSEVIHFGPTTQPIKILVRREMNGIRKLLLM